MKTPFVFRVSWDIMKRIGTDGTYSQVLQISGPRWKSSEEVSAYIQDLERGKFSKLSGRRVLVCVAEVKFDMGYERHLEMSRMSSV